MSGTVITGPTVRSLARDEEGHRDYEVKHLVKTSSAADGPQVVMNTPGLPAIGATWAFGNDLDVWAFCWPNMTVAPKVKNETTIYWVVKQKFSTKPLKRCQDEAIEDPLLEPQKVSGSFVRGTVEATEDRNGNKIQNSVGEPVRGPQVEFDDYNPSVIIEQNVTNLGLPDFADMVNKVNDAPLWGMAARTIKLSGAPWSRKLHGICDFYFTRRFEFQLDKNTFDRDDIMDEGTKAFGKRDAAGDWQSNGESPADGPAAARRFTDKDGNIARVLLDGFGLPLAAGADPVAIPNSPIEYYKEANFLLLGIPVDLEAK